MLAQLAAPTGEGAKAGPIALLVILLLCIACYFLFRSMTKHLRKVNAAARRNETAAASGPAAADPATGDTTQASSPDRRGES